MAELQGDENDWSGALETLAPHSGHFDEESKGSRLYAEALVHTGNHTRAIEILRTYVELNRSRLDQAQAYVRGVELACADGPNEHPPANCLRARTGRDPSLMHTLHLMHDRPQIDEATALLGLLELERARRATTIEGRRQALQTVVASLEQVAQEDHRARVGLSIARAALRTDSATTSIHFDTEAESADHTIQVSTLLWRWGWEDSALALAKRAYEAAPGSKTGKQAAYLIATRSHETASRPHPTRGSG